MESLQTWSVRAINLAEHRDNVVHTDAGAKAAGYPSALVAGTTVYAYLTHPAAAAWGRSWVDHGGAEVRFLRPVFDDDAVSCVPVASDDGLTIEAQVGGDARATLAVWQDPGAPGPHEGEPLHEANFVFGDDLAGYGGRCGDDLEMYAAEGMVHPVVWPVIGNRVTMATLVTGPWIHVRSRVQHLGPVGPGARADVKTTLVKRYTTRAGERAVLDIRVDVDGVPVAAIEHESIITLS